MSFLSSLFGNKDKPPAKPAATPPPKGVAGGGGGGRTAAASQQSSAQQPRSVQPPAGTVPQQHHFHAHAMNVDWRAGNMRPVPVSPATSTPQSPAPTTGTAGGAAAVSSPPLAMGGGGGFGMFEGLALKSSATSPSPAPTASTAAGGNLFGGMTVAGSAKPNGTATTDSGKPNGAAAPVPAAPGGPVTRRSRGASAASDAQSDGGSAFGFMSGGGDDTDSAPAATAPNGNGTTKSSAPAAGSNDDLLASLVGQTTDAPPPSLDAPAPAKPAAASVSAVDDKPASTAAPDSSKARTSSVSGSQFSFLSSATEAAASATTDATPAPPAGGGFGGLDFTGMTIRAAPASNRSENTTTPKAASESAASAYGAIASSSSPAAATSTLSTDDTSSTPAAAAAAVAATSAAGDSIEQKANAARARLEAVLSQHWKHISQVTEQQNALRVRELALDGSLRASTTALAVADAQQQKASESEEFDKADHLERVMQDTKKEIISLNKQLATVKDQSKDLESKKLSGAAGVVAAVRACSRVLEELQSAQSTRLTAFITDTNKKMDIFEDKWNADRDRIERVLKHVATDLDAVQSEESIIEQAITAQTKDVLIERSNLMMTEDKIKADIEELKRQIAVKEAELSACRTQLDSANSKIQAARVGHERKLNRINEKKERIRGDKKSAEDEMRALESGRRVWEAENVKTKNERKQYRTVLARITHQLKSSSHLASRLDSDDDRRREWLDAVSREASESSALVRQLDAVNAELDSTRRKISEIDHTIATHTQAVATIELKLPALEAEKKHSAATRDFKTAARVAKEIKDFQANRQKASDTITELKLQTATLHLTLTEKSNLKSQITEKIESAETTRDTNRFKLMLGREKYLQMLVSRGWVGWSHNELEQSALRTELDALQSDLRALRDRHHWPADHLHAETGYDSKSGADAALADSVAPPIEVPVTDADDDTATASATATANDEKRAAAAAAATAAAASASAASTDDATSPSAAAAAATTPASNFAALSAIMDSSKPVAAPGSNRSAASAASPSAAATPAAAASPVSSASGADAAAERESKTKAHIAMCVQNKAMEEQIAAALARDDFDTCDKLDADARALKVQLIASELWFTERKFDVPTAAAADSTAAAAPATAPAPAAAADSLFAGMSVAGSASTASSAEDAASPSGSGGGSLFAGLAVSPSAAAAAAADASAGGDAI